MAVQQPRSSKEEFALRGDEIYESQVRPLVETGNHGKIVAIDIETGAFYPHTRAPKERSPLQNARFPDASEFFNRSITQIFWG